MKLPSVISAMVGAALLCAAPVSVDRSTEKGGSLSIGIQTADAAELGVPAYEGSRRYARYYRVAYYHPFCGGPYVGGGWNGGTYYGGPWMDLRCYGLLPW